MNARQFPLTIIVGVRAGSSWLAALRTLCLRIEPGEPGLEVIPAVRFSTDWVHHAAVAQRVVGLSGTVTITACWPDPGDGPTLSGGSAALSIALAVKWALTGREIPDHVFSSGYLHEDGAVPPGSPQALTAKLACLDHCWKGARPYVFIAGHNARTVPPPNRGRVVGVGQFCEAEEVLERESR